MCGVACWMIRMMCGVWLVDRVLTDVLQDRVGVVVNIEDTIIQSHLRWYGHVIHKTSTPKYVQLWNLQVVSATFLLFCFVSLNKTTCETRKMFFIPLQKLFLFLRKSKFRILQIQISWHHQIPKYKERKTFYWITWKVNTICQWNLARLYHITKEKKFIKKFCKNCDLKTSSRPFCVCKELAQPLLENEIFEASY